MTLDQSEPNMPSRHEEFSRLLVVGGSDPSGGAGIQADIKTGALLGVEVAAVVSAITAQNSLRVQAAWPVPVEMFTAQLASVCEDIPPHALKLGMLCDALRVEAVEEAIRRYHISPVVCDPVLVSTSGRRLLDEPGKRALLALLPRIYLLTPNVQEAAELSGRRVNNAEELVDAGRALLDRGVWAVLLKGGHIEGDDSTDILLRAGDTAPLNFSAPRIATRNDHGTGCVLASAIAVQLARGNDLPEAIATARSFLLRALHGAAHVWNGGGRGGMKLSRI